MENGRRIFTNKAIRLNIDEVEGRIPSQRRMPGTKGRFAGLKRTGEIEAFVADLKKKKS